jgi:hypothetical protein
VIVIKNCFVSNEYVPIQGYSKATPLFIPFSHPFKWLHVKLFLLKHLQISKVLHMHAGIRSNISSIVKLYSFLNLLARVLDDWFL